MGLEGKAAAKINLAIDVLSKRPDGYHDVVMIMQQVALFDTITVKSSKKGEIKLTSNTNRIPLDEANIVYKAAMYLKTKYSVKLGAIINIDKVIPIAAGLAGGSTDAAMTLKLLDRVWDLKLTKAELLDAGRKLGSDVPFCLEGGTALAEGLGDKLTRLKPMPECYILLAKPSISISTKDVYQGIDFLEILDRPNIDDMIKAINNEDILGVCDNLCNVLENVTIKMCPLIKDLKSKLIENGALGSMMSGSGPTVFGIFLDQFDAYRAYDHVKGMVNEIFVVKTTNQTWEDE